jgi:hypothetical protein
MKKFANLLRKEIKELVTVQLIVSLAFMLILFNFIGRTSRKEVEKAMGVQTIAVLDLDRSPSSRGILTGLETARFKIESMEGKTHDESIEAAGRSEAKLLLVIPEGFGDSLQSLVPREVETYSFMRSFSLIGARSQVIVRAVISALNDAASNSFLREKLPEYDPDGLKNPIQTRDYVIVKDRMAEGSANMVAGLVTSQSLLIPVVLMMIVIYSSQMVISAVAMEKQNKTLETLLTVPIRRTSIITAKMLSAGLVGLISAFVYMMGFRSFVGGMGADDIQAAAGQSGAIDHAPIGAVFRRDRLRGSRDFPVPGYPRRPGHGHDPGRAGRGLPQRPEHDHAAHVHGHGPLLHLPVRGHRHGLPARQNPHPGHSLLPSVPGLAEHLSRQHRDDHRRSRLHADLVYRPCGIRGQDFLDRPHPDHEAAFREKEGADGLTPGLAPEANPSMRERDSDQRMNIAGQP